MPPSPDAAPLPYLDWILYTAWRDYLARAALEKRK